MTDTSDEADPLLGSTLLGKLRVIRRIGVGGMGTVYEVEHLGTRHHRALKVLHGRSREDHRAVERFVREATVAGTLRSPHVVETIDAGTLEDGAPYVLMELLEGVTLAQLLDEGDLEPGRAVRLVREACRGVADAHAAEIVHRDLKPENLFVTRDADGTERLKILDFGISKFLAPEHLEALTVTREGTILGTPCYMSPEQAVGKTEQLDARTDVYALGVILYESLTGRRPYDAPTFPALLIAIHAGDHEPLDQVAPELPRELVEVVERAMARKKQDRHGSAKELLEALAPFDGDAFAWSAPMGRAARREARTQTEDRAALSLAPTLMSENVVAPAPTEAPISASIDASRVTESALPANHNRTLLYGLAAALLVALVGGVGWLIAGGASPDPEPATVRATPTPRPTIAPTGEPEASREAEPTPATPIVQTPIEEPGPSTRRRRDPAPAEPNDRFAPTRDNPYD